MTTPAPITPAAFAAKWKRTKLSERAASQEHFIDLCRLLGQPTPAEHDATGSEYTFEKSIAITTPASLGSKGEHGFADVWWKNKFAWEYKRQRKHKTLEDAYAQLQRYREALDNPPLLIVSDIDRTQIHTNFTNTATQIHTITLQQIADGAGIDLLRRIFTDPDSFKPTLTTEDVTKTVATEIGKIARRLQDKGHDPHAVAHFLMKCTFCLFAEDVDGLLPNKIFKKLLQKHYQDPPRFTKLVNDLFKTMATGGDFGADQIPYFNGGLFDDSTPIELSTDDLGTLNLAADQDWSAIEPSILGTLFERSLDPTKRAQIGAHYTSKEDILLVIDPVIMHPLRRQWSTLKSQIESEIQTLQAQGSQSLGSPNTKTSKSGKTTTLSPLTSIHEKISNFTAQLSSYKILDPACGSGNFLYVAIQQLLSLEKEVITFAAQPPINLRLQPRVRPTQLLGLEINPYAAELAQVAIWIGFLQWMHHNGFSILDIPILNKLTTIENRDAILDHLAPGESPGAVSSASPPQAQGSQSLGSSPSEISNTKSAPPSGLPRRDPSEPGQRSPTPTEPSGSAAGPPRRSSEISNTKSPSLPTPALWPNAHFIIGNPPFLGSNLFRQNGLPDDYIQALYKAYDLPKTSDLCCYWFELARRKLESATHLAPGDSPGASKRAKPSKATAQPIANSKTPEISNLKSSPDFSLPRIGLLATQGIRGGDNRTVLQRIKHSGDIFMAWSDKEWVLNGATVHTAIIGFDNGSEGQRSLDGKTAAEINADLSVGFDPTSALVVPDNSNIAFQGPVKVGDFDIDLKTTRDFLKSPNPTNTTNADVIREWLRGEAINQRVEPTFIIDFEQRSLAEAAQYELPFEHTRKLVKPARDKSSDKQRQTFWWRLGRSGSDFRVATHRLKRYLATCQTAKYRLFAWATPESLPAQTVIAFARADNYFMGVLHSSVHEIWVRAMGTQLREEESGSRYTPTTCFETFPLPWLPSREKTKHPAHARISAAAKELNDLRERWLNPPELINPLAQIIDANDKFLDVPEPARPLIRWSAIMAEAAKSPNLKKRTLTNLYNERPTWLKLAHEKLDRAVLATYAAIDPEGGWSEDWAELYTETGPGQPLPPNHPLAAQRTATDQLILTNLLRLNHQRAASPMERPVKHLEAKPRSP